MHIDCYGNSGYGVSMFYSQNQLVLLVNINGRTAISVNFSKSKRGGPQKTIKSSANDSVIFKPKIQVRGAFQSVKLMESRCLIKLLKI